jgi:hypothetical protein
MEAEQLAAAAAKIQSVQRGRFVRSQKRRSSAETNKTARAQREAAGTLEVKSYCNISAPDSFLCLRSCACMH